MSENLVNRLYKITVPLLVIYFLCMFILPWFLTSFSWEKVQNVWDRWQSLNVGALAFSSSLIAFSISKFKEEKQREREFRAAQSFLPEALSELSNYLKLSSRILKDRAEKSLSNNRNKYIKTPGTENLPGCTLFELEQFEIPAVPDNYKEVFTNCIRHAKPDVGEYLADILRELQIYNSRIQDMNAENLQSYDMYYKTCLYRLGELQALINNLFDFARNESDQLEPFANKWEDYDIAYRNLSIRLEDFRNLEEFTKRMLSSKKKN